MSPRLPILLATLWLVLLAAGVRAQVAQPVTGGVSISATNETTTLDRATRRLHSSVRLTVQNNGGALIGNPLHLVVGFTEANGQPLDPIKVTGALGGIGVAPYNRHYFDCDDKAGGDGLAPGESFQLTLAFDRPRTLVVSYQPELWGFVNQPPLVLAGGPYRATAGEMVTLDASGSSDPEGDELTFSWRLPDGTLLEGPSVQTVFTQAGIQQVTLAIRDSRGATSLQQIEVAVLPAGEFALGRTRVIDGEGHPLDEVTVVEEGPGGSSQFVLQDGGFASLGSVPGDYLWRFSKAGHLGVCRRATLAAGEVGVIPNPWLAKLSTTGIGLSVINNSTIASGDGSLVIRFPGGAFTQVGQAFLTSLQGQSLPGELPPGWSPLRVFHLQLPQTPLQAGTVEATLPGAPPAGRQLVFAQFDPAGCEWVARQLPASGNASPSVPLTAPGSFAFLLADGDPTAPPPAGIGDPLEGFGGGLFDGEVTAEGSLDPPESVASRVAAEVTSQASVIFRGAVPMASGSWFRGDVREEYELSDGQRVVLPDHDQIYYAYRGLGGDAQALQAGFPVRPTFLFGPEELTLARVRVDVSSPLEFAGGIVAPDGGVLSTGPVTLTLPAGAVTATSAVGLRILPTGEFTAFAGGLEIVSAFGVDVGDLAAGTEFGFTFATPVAPDASFLLAKLTRAGNRSGLRPVLRLASDAAGVLSSVEPPSEPRLNGVRGPGTFLLLRTPEPLALIQGRTLNASSVALPAVAVSVVSSPWLCLSDASGGYELVDAAGPGSLFGQHLATGDAATADYEVDAGLAPLAIDLTIGPSGPSVLATTPPAGATGVSRVTPVSVVFSEPIDPATFGADAVVLRLTGTGEVVPASLSLAPGNTAATLLPTNPLEYGTGYTIEVAETIADPTGLPLEGNRFFGFATVAAPVRVEGAQLVIYEPGAANIPQEVLDELVGYQPGVDTDVVVCTGTQGTADPEVPVILVNDITGATATVLSKPDGSFATFIEAEEEDFIKAVFVNRNGTRIEVPATRQLFDSGKVGLYRYGGILEAESDGSEVQVFIEPEAVASRTTFQVSPVSLTRMLQMVEGVEPQGGKLLGGISYAEGIDPITIAADVAISVNEADLGLPEGSAPEDAAFALTIPRKIGDKIVYDVVDKMTFVRQPDGKTMLKTASPPFMGLLLRELTKIQGDTPRLDGLIEARKQVLEADFPPIPGTLGLAFDLADTFAAILVSVSANVIASGTVEVVGALAGGGDPGPDAPGDPLAGAFITFESILLSENDGFPDASNIIASPFLDGMTIATTRANGRYSLITNAFVVGGGGSIRARHPRFPYQKPKSSGVFTNPFAATIIEADLRFLKPNPADLALPDQGPPSLNASHFPSFPLVDEVATLNVVAVDDVQVASITATLSEFIEFGSGKSKDLGLVTLNQTSTSQPVATRFLKTFTVEADEPGLVRIDLYATDSSGNSKLLNYTIPFGTGGFAEDATVPRGVLVSWPPDGAEGVALLTPLFLRFNKPLPESALVDLPTIESWLTLSNGFSLTLVDASPDRREITAYYDYAGDPGGQTLTVTLNSTVIDPIPGAPPGTGGSYSYSFEFADGAGMTLPGGISTGGGVALTGSMAYALSRGEPSKILAIDLSDPANPQVVDEKEPFGRPTDLAVIPAYPLARKSGTTISFPVKDYLAVFSGDPAGFKVIELFELDPANGSLGKVYQSALSREIAQVVKTKWDPPYLAFMELSATTTNQVQLMDLNAFTIAKGSTEDEIGAFPLFGTPGVDVNADGDYADAGDTPPVPARNALFFGQAFSFAPSDPSERIVDFDFDANFGLLGVVYDDRLQMVLGGSTATLLPETAVLDLPERAKRVKFLPGTTLFDGTADLLLDVAIVSTAPDANGLGQLILVDVTDPEAPTLLKQLTLPSGSGAAGSIIEREDGRLALATGSGAVYLIDPRQLLRGKTMGFMSGNTDELGSVVGTLAGMGSGVRSFVSNDAGVSVVNGGGNQRVLFTGPQIEVVTLDKKPETIATLEALDPVELSARLDAAEPTIVAETSPFHKLDPAAAVPAPDPKSHYYLRIRAPGGSGESLKLTVASAGPRTETLMPGCSNVVPTFLGEDDVYLKSLRLLAARYGADLKAEAVSDFVDRANKKYDEISDTDESAFYPRTIEARRLSDSPTSELYNTYLAGPLVLLPKPLEKSLFDRLQAGEAESLERFYLRAAQYFWAGIDPAEDMNPVLGGFVSSLQTDFDGIDPSVALTENKIDALALVDTRSLARPGVNDLQRVAFERNPIIFIPGIAGSFLADGPLKPQAPTVYWVNTDITNYLSSSGRDYLKDLALGDLAPGNAPTIEAVDALRAVEKLGKGKAVYKQFLQMLREDLLYTEYDFSEKGMGGLDLDMDPNWESMLKGPDLFVFPYDWRLDNAGSADQLGKYVDLVNTVHPGSRVDIIAHSMGGLVARSYIVDHADRVDRLITLGTPFLGAPKAISAMYTGDFDDFMLNILIPKDVLRQVARYSPAVQQLLPSEKLFDPLGERPMIETGWNVDEDGLGFEAYDYQGYKEAMDEFLFPEEDFTDAGGNTVTASNPAPIATNNAPFHNAAQDDWSNDNNSVRNFHIVGVQSNPQTITRIRLDAAMVPNLDDGDDPLEDGEKEKDITISAPPVEFFESESVFGNNFPLIPEDPENLPIGLDVYRLDYGMVPVRGAGDGTVPLLSAARGYGSDHDLNAPGAVVIPLVSRAPEDMQEEVAGHNEMLLVRDHEMNIRDTRLRRLVERILDNDLHADEDLPGITISTGGSVQEGTPLTFFATPTTTPADAEGDPRYLWDTGDAGIIVSGSSGSHTYPDDGTYTLSCAVGYENEPAAIEGETITITNAPPTVTLVADPTNPKPYELVTITATVTDPGRDDTHTLSWDLGDDSAVGEELDPGTFRVKHRYTEEGNYTVRVDVEDDDGGVGTDMVSISVTNSPSGPTPIPPPNPVPAPAPPLNQASEYVFVCLSGYQPNDNNFTVEHGQTSIWNFSLTEFILDKLASMVAGETSGRQYCLQVFREIPRGESALPMMSKVSFEAEGKPTVTVRMVYFKDGEAQRCFRWAANVMSEDDDVSLSIPWDQFTGGLGTIDAIEGLLTASGGLEYLETVEPAECDDLKGPAINVSKDPTTRTFEVVVSDDHSPVEDIRVFLMDITELEEQPVDDVTQVDEPPVITAEDAETLEARRLEPVPGKPGTFVVDDYAVPGRQLAILAEDGLGNVTILTADKTRIEESVDFAVFEKVRQAVQRAYLEGSGQEFYRKFVSSNADVLIFEQGSGACLWKKSAVKCARAYKNPGSDNDYELFLPVFLGDAPFLVPPAKLDANDALHQVSFEENAFTDETMAGDWYFKLPRGLDASGADLGPPPDPTDQVRYQDYLGRVATWKYTLPMGFENRLSESTFEVGKNQSVLGEPIFQRPKTPADMVSFVLTANLKQSSTEIDGRKLSQILPDVSFFPFRREHFLFATMSLERPPPFGDDAIGDAGMGRGLLLLKWVLEGAFLPEFGDFNVGFDADGMRDVALRTEVFDRLKTSDRQERLKVEAYEWGIYQEFAALSEGVHLRVEVPPMNGGGSTMVRKRQLMFGDYFKSKDKKALKKAGKAAIRGVLARLAEESGTRSSLFALTPEQFDDREELASFEHLVAELGKQHLSQFPGFTSQDMDDFLGAKVANPKVLKRILDEDDGVDNFVLKATDLLRTQVQMETIDTYTDYMDDLLLTGTENAVEEWNYRFSNACAVDFGIETFSGSTSKLLPGRLKLHGVVPGHNFRFNFVVNCHNHTDIDPVSVRIAMDPGIGQGVGPAGGLEEIVTIPAGKDLTVERDDEADTGFYLERQADERDAVDGSFELMDMPIPTEENANEFNDGFEFEHEILNIGFYGGRSSATRVEATVDVTDRTMTASTPDTILKLRLVSAVPPNEGQPIAGGNFFYVDAGGNRVGVTNSELLVSSGVQMEPIQYPIAIFGESTGSGGESQVSCEPLKISADLREIYRTAREPTGPERKFLDLVHTTIDDLNTDIRFARQSIALAPSAHPFLNLVDVSNTVTGLASLMASPNFGADDTIRFANNATVVDGLSVETWVNDFKNPDDPARRGLPLDAWVPGTNQTTAINIFNQQWNPGRNAKLQTQEERDDRERFFDGKIFIHEALRDSPPPSGTLPFTNFTQSPAFNMVQLIQVELFHEMNARMFDIKGRGLGGGNVAMDRTLRVLYPNIEPVSGFFF